MVVPGHDQVGAAAHHLLVQLLEVDAAGVVPDHEAVVRTGAAVLAVVQVRVVAQHHLPARAGGGQRGVQPAALFAHVRAVPVVVRVGLRYVGGDRVGVEREELDERFPLGAVCREGDVVVAARHVPAAGRGGVRDLAVTAGGVAAAAGDQPRTVVVAQHHQPRHVDTGVGQLELLRELRVVVGLRAVLVDVVPEADRQPDVFGAADLRGRRRDRVLLRRARPGVAGDQDGVLVGGARRGRERKPPRGARPRRGDRGPLRPERQRGQRRSRHRPAQQRPPVHTARTGRRVRRAVRYGGAGGAGAGRPRPLVLGQVRPRRDQLVVAHGWLSLTGGGATGDGAMNAVWTSGKYGVARPGRATPPGLPAGLRVSGRDGPAGAVSGRSAGRTGAGTPAPPAPPAGCTSGPAH